ncbi:hypothetical protein [Sphingomonas sp. Y38-1Y]|uniref:hypothetical protein n=1 Tax=Sphingomonas sp. Y38-1Y TaxID=3078265 RepID=UPI0028EDCBB8|nr:hypothetical protein [Sphingomonas sp. Y38-1Y]
MIASVETLVTLLALAALLVARTSVARAGSAVGARLRALYTLTAWLLAFRLLAALSPSAPVIAALMVVAAWLPLAAVRLVEELCRRHAPRSVKLLALGGALVFSGVAVTLGLVWSDGAVLALAGYQSVMLAAMIALLVRERGGLGPAERRTADTFLLALVLTIPLALTDFVALFPALPVRGGVVAILLLVLAASRLTIDRGTPAGLLADIAVASGASGVLVLAALLMLPALPDETVARLAVAGWAVAALLLLIERAAGRRTRASGLVAALARVESDEPAAILSAHPLLAGGRVIEGQALAAYPEASLAELLRRRVIAGERAGDAARDLLQAAQATHLLRLSRVPPRLLAINAGGLAGAALDAEIELAARLVERPA